MPYQIISSLIIFQHIKSYVICDENKSIIGRENMVLNISNLSPVFNNLRGPIFLSSMSCLLTAMGRRGLGFGEVLAGRGEL